MRSGLIAQKVGMTRVFNDEGAHVPVTVLKVDGCPVVSVRTKDKDGYSAVQLGVGARKPKHTTKPMRGHFAKAGVEPKRTLAEFRVSEDALLDVGDRKSVVSRKSESVRVDIGGSRHFTKKKENKLH